MSIRMSSESAEPIALSGMRRRWQACLRGVTALEFAMLAPVFLVMVFGALQVALAFHNGNTVRHAVKKAARELMFDKSITEEQLQALVDAQLAELSPSGLAVDVDLTLDTSGSVPIANVTGSYVMPVSIPMVARFDARFNIDLVVLQSPD